jgi:hypothetical protein
MSIRWLRAALGVLTCVNLGACASPAPDAAQDVTQESALLSVRATVLSSAYPLSEALVPALTFTPFITNWGHSEFIVSGDFDGEIFGGFALHIHEPPPAEALTVLTRGEPQVAVGGFTLVSPDHPARLDWKRDATGQMEVCADDGECGVPSPSACGSAAAPSCMGTLVPGKNWGNHGVSGHYVVMYLADTAQAGGVYSQFFAQGQELSAGYHVISYEDVWQTLDAGARLANAQCQDRATAAALSQFNTDHSTQYTDPSRIADGGQEGDTQLLAAWDGLMLAASVAQGCVIPGSQRVVQEPDAEKPLGLVLVAL